MTKKWYIRKENTSRYIKSDYVYYITETDWTTDISKAKALKTKKEAKALSLEIGGELYGE